ncbi:hypothetical protein [Commensalibacter communis]|uniref:hypothetical protein n=1 Tax=Commensalibacter communis TaxID=2972786 RepID=UPI00232F25C7|nr:hypothetical protein [Commensalibacter communis]
MNLLLNDDWDIYVDGTGQLAVTPSGEYNVAQMVANEVKLFLGEGWYDRSQGLPHFAITFSANPNLPLIQTLILDHVNDVEGVVESDMDFYVDNERTMRGVIIASTSNGKLVNVQY